MAQSSELIRLRTISHNHHNFNERSDYLANISLIKRLTNDNESSRIFYSILEYLTSRNTFITSNISCTWPEEYENINSFNILLKFAGIFNKKSNFKLFYLTCLITCLIWLIFFYILWSFLYQISINKIGHIYSNLTGVIWVLHCNLSYTYAVIDSIGKNELIFSVIYAIKSTNSSKGANIDQKLIHLSNKIVGVIYFITFVNMFGVILYSDFFIYLVPSSKHLPVHIILLIGWYFITYGWTISFLYVCLTTYPLYFRIMEFVNYVESHDPENYNLLDVMTWYDELHHANKHLSGYINQLITISFGLLAPNTVFILLVCFLIIFNLFLILFFNF